LNGSAPRTADRDAPYPTAPRLLRGRLFALLAACVTAGIAIDRMIAGRPLDTIVTAVLAVGLALGLGFVLSVRLFAALRRSQDHLRERYRQVLADALTDQLTQLGNHRAFHEELDRQVEHAQRYEAPLALVLLDIDDFKSINDTLGHAGGDRALAQLGRFIHLTVRKVDAAFRIGGDEFAILLSHTDAEGARVMANRLLAASLQPDRLARSRRDATPAPLEISFSAGVAAIPESAANRSQLYAQADAALYAAKRNGRTAVEVFRDEPTSVGPADPSSAVAEVIARGLLRPVYQPVVELASGRVIGYEGLVRPMAPSPFVDPAGLFAAAEATGRLVTLDVACVELIVGGAAQLAGDLFLSVNLSPRTVEAPEFAVSTLLGILGRHRFPPERLILELTEHEPMSDPQRARTKLETFRAAGFRLAADDVGAGNAGLRLLSQLRFDILKVDLSLVRDSAAGDLSRAVVSSVVELAARTGAFIIAEGVEQPAQRQQLLALGIKLGQGYLLGRPGELPATAGTPTSNPWMTRAPSPMRAWRETIGLPSGVGPR
jgi:diguanylate cyclase (GGDEF)-like protein